MVDAIEKNETITFELIRRIQREEQVLPKLTKLPENFYENTKNYLEQKKKIIAIKENKMNILEIKGIERLVEDIFNRRERKICNQAIITARTGIPPENLTGEEQIFFDSVMQPIKFHRVDKLDPIFAITQSIKAPEPEIQAQIAEIEAETESVTAPKPEVAVPEITSPEIVVSLVKVKFLEDTPEFIGSDMQTYGPFNAGDVGAIPIENFDLLADKLEKLD
jgi:DNA replication initiation complex subunit (GINS family)